MRGKYIKKGIEKNQKKSAKIANLLEDLRLLKIFI